MAMEIGGGDDQIERHAPRHQRWRRTGGDQMRIGRGLGGQGIEEPAGEARSEPNQNPQLPEPLRRMPWDETPLASSSLGCCGGICSGGGNMAA